MHMNVICHSECNKDCCLKKSLGRKMYRNTLYSMKMVSRNVQAVLYMIWNWKLMFLKLLGESHRKRKEKSWLMRYHIEWQIKWELHLKWIAKVHLIHGASQKCMLTANQFDNVNRILGNWKYFINIQNFIKPFSLNLEYLFPNAHRYFQCIVFIQKSVPISNNQKTLIRW